MSDELHDFRAAVTHLFVVSVTNHSNSQSDCVSPHNEPKLRDTVTEMAAIAATNHEYLPQTNQRRGPGRPRKANALSNADRSRNYRARKKVRAAELRDPEVPLSSKVIDLTALPAWKRK